ncbi:MAG: AAA family ATPase [Terriglobia bacterium]
MVGGIPVELRPVQHFQLIQAGYTGVPIHHTPEEMNELTLVLGSMPRNLLGSLHPVLPLRGFEEWAYPSTTFPGRENLDRLVLSDRAVALTNALSANSRLRTEISDRLKSLVEIGIDFEIASAHRVKVFATSPQARRAETLFLNEGMGANQLPFILVPIALAKPGETILLSEPEAHLHPKKQSELTGLLLTIARKRNLQFFIETHSEHVLHKLLHAVAKGDLAKDELALYYFENDNGAARVRRLEVDEKGGVKGGLPGFFDQSLSELSDYLDALKGTK